MSLQAKIIFELPDHPLNELPLTCCPSERRKKPMCGRLRASASTTVATAFASALSVPRKPRRERRQAAHGAPDDVSPHAERAHEMLRDVGQS